MVLHPVFFIGDQRVDIYIVGRPEYVFFNDRMLYQIRVPMMTMTMTI